jgi:hypothetical protein
MSYYVQIPQTTLDANGLFINLGMLTTVNITMVNGSQTNCVITLTGANGIGHTYNLNAGNPLLIKKAEIISLKAMGNGAIIAGVLSWPNEVDPSSITISQPVAIADQPISVGGTVNVGNTADINISSVSSGVSVPVTGSVDITNSSIPVTGTVNLGSTANVNISSVTSGVSVPVTGSVDITNSSIPVTGTVNLGNTADVNISSISSGVTLPVNGNINVTNTSLDVTGTVDIGNTVDINVSSQSGNVAVNVAESVQLPTDIGNLAQQTQETQYSGTNLFTYNPWGFSTATIPAPASGRGLSNDFCNLQQSGARGYIETIYFCVYNPATVAQSATITVNLYTHLPVDGPAGQDGFITSFTFNTGTIAASSGAWITVNPNIFWRYNTLVVIPQQTTGTGGSSIGVISTAGASSLNSETFYNGYWSANPAIACYWSITNTTTPNTLPVAVESGNITIERTNIILPTQEVLTPNIYTNTITTATNVTISPVPSGYAWKIKSIAFSWTAGSTLTAYPSVSYIPNNAPFTSTYNQNVYSIAIITLNETNGEVYAVLLSTIAQNKSSSFVDNLYQTIINLPQEIIMFNGDQLFLSTGGNTSSFTYAIQYTQHTTGTVA